MSTTRTWIGSSLVGILAVAAAAQTAHKDQRPSRQQPQMLFLTDEIVDLALDRLADKMAKEYSLDEDQLWNTRDLLHERFPEFIKQNRGEIVTLVNDYLKATLSGEPPSPEYVADWAERAAPLLNEALDMAEDTADDMRPYMTDEQQILLDGRLAAFRVGRQYMTQRMNAWRAGQYDWQTEWPRSEAFKKNERIRQRQLHEQAQVARYEAMGVTPSEGVVLAADRSAVRPHATRARGPRDEWAQYVESFIKRYQLNEAQQNSARKYMRRYQDLRDKYVRRRGPSIDAIAAQAKAAKTDNEKQRAAAELARLNRPIDRLFENLKDDLNKLPTRKQRAAAAARHEQARDRVAQRESAADALKDQMDARTQAAKGDGGGGRKPD